MNEEELYLKVIQEEQAFQLLMTNVSIILAFILASCFAIYLYFKDRG
jgi:hypothetical protein|tara:strand:+ start:619 stop:759 length:141 start_codon:yes stop_codon:yes gene_type:complete